MSAGLGLQVTCRPAVPVAATGTTSESVANRAAPSADRSDRPTATGLVDKKPQPRPLRRCFTEDSAQSPPRSLSMLLAQSADRFEQGMMLAKQSALTATAPSPATVPTVPIPAPTPAPTPALTARTAIEPATVVAHAEPALAKGNPLSTAQFEEALACAEEALRLDSRSVEALHNRGLALQELGQLDLARDAFTRALAIDPDDPETLAGAADLYVNRLSPSVELSEIGVEYAHHGGQRLRRSLGLGLAKNPDLAPEKLSEKLPGKLLGKLKEKPKDRSQRALLGRLLLLEAQGLNDLGRPRAALSRLDAAIVASDSNQARYERAMALLDLCRFAEAQRSFHDVVEREPDDAWAHYGLGLTLEMLGLPAAADQELAQARQLAPHEFPPPLPVSPQQFRALVDKEVQGLTPGQRADLRHVTLQTSDLPELGDLTAEEPPLSPTILGLFRGLPLAERGPADREPRAIVLYRKNLLRAVRVQDELVDQIRTTLLHELGHLRGEDDAELRARGLE